MMEGLMDDLIAFLRARLDGTRAAIIRYRDGHEGPHINYAGQDPNHYDEYDVCHRCIEVAKLTPYRDVEFGLRDVEAKRAIVDELHFIDAGVRIATPEYRSGLITAVRNLASAWSDHPQYDERWAP